MRGVLVVEGVTVYGYFLFLLLEDIGGTEGGAGKGGTDRRTRVRVGTKGRLLTGRGWCLDDLCLDDTKNLPDLTTNRGDNHRNLVEEVTSITCASQVRVPLIRLSEIAS